MDENNGRLKELEVQATVRARQKAEEFQEKIDSLKNGILELQRKKLAIRKGKISLAEAIEQMKEDRRTGLQWIKERFVKANLNTYISGFRSLQNWESLRIHQFQALEWARFIYAWIDDAMIEGAAKGLDGGPDEKERTKQIGDLDKQIIKLESEMESLLK